MTKMCLDRPFETVLRLNAQKFALLGEELMLVKNHSIAQSARRNLHSWVISKNIKELMLVKNCSLAYNVARDLFFLVI